MKSLNLITKNKIDIKQILDKWLTSNTFSEDGVFFEKFENGENKTIIFIAEDYYFRIGSNLTITLIIKETIETIIVEIIVSGGKSGFDGFSFGAENNAVKRIVKLLKNYGFIEQK